MATLEERIAKLEAKKAQQQAAIDAQLKKLHSQAKTKERKERTRRLIQLGGLVEKAGLGDMDPTALLGMLIQQKDFLEKTPGVFNNWKKQGADFFEKEKEERGSNSAPKLP